MTVKLGLGFKLNNPGHIERGNSKWQGLAPVQAHPRFATFIDAVYGIRAMAVTLITYQDKYGIRTILDAIKRYAPTKDGNPTAGYAQFVAKSAGLATGGIIDFHDYRYMRGIIEAMIRFELAGQPYTAAQIDKGLALAGIEPPKRSLAKSGTVNAATVGAAASTTAIVSGAVAQLEPALPIVQQVGWMVRDMGPAFLVIGGVALLGLFGYIAYRRWDDHRRLAR